MLSKLRELGGEEPGSEGAEHEMKEHEEKEKEEEEEEEPPETAADRVMLNNYLFFTAVLGVVVWFAPDPKPPEEESDCGAKRASQRGSVALSQGGRMSAQEFVGDVPPQRQSRASSSSRRPGGEA